MGRAVWSKKLKASSYFHNRVVVDDDLLSIELKKSELIVN